MPDRDTPKNGIRNGRRWFENITIGKLAGVAVVFVLGNGTCVAAKSCTKDAAPIVGLQTTAAAAASEQKNTDEHEILFEENEHNQKVARHLKYQLEDVLDVVEEDLASRSKRRLDEVKKRRRDKWRERRRKEAEIEAAREAARKHP